MSLARASRSRPDMEALVVTPGFVPCGCVIERVTEDESGILLELSKVTSPAVSEHLSTHRLHQAMVSAFVDDGQERHQLHFRGSVRAGQDGQIGLHLEEPLDEDRENLALLNQNRNANQPDRSQRLSSLKNLYAQHCRRLLERLLPGFLEATLEGIESDLQQSAEVRVITRLKDMRFIFQSRQQQMLKDFQAQFQANQSNLEPISPRPGSSKELHLLERHEFEDWLDLQAISRRITDQHDGLTFVLNQFLNQVFHHDVTDRNNPLTPKALSVCLQYTVDHLGIAREHRPTLYRAWETILASVWPAAIRSMINDFRRAGLEALELTELPANWSVSLPAKASKETPSDPSDFSSEVRGGAEPSKAAPTAGQSLFRMMSLEAGAPSANPKWQVPNLELRRNLQPRRQQILSQLKDEASDMEGLLRALADSDATVAGAIDSTTLEKARLVDRIFAPLDHQTELSSTLRHGLQTLRLPFFENLIETPEFLDREDHPARDVINDLMQLCLAQRASSKKLEATVAGIIDELTAMETSDTALLEAVGTRLRQLIERQDQSFLRNSERLAQNLEGKERLRRTRQQVKQRLNEMLGGRQVPDILIRLLEAGWEQLIVLTLLRQGPDSRACEELFSTVAQLQDWLSPDGASADLAFEKELESGVLIQFIERELKAAGDLPKARSVIDELAQVLDGDSDAQIIQIDTYGAPDPADAHLPAELENSRWAARAREISVGDWVEVRLESNDVRRMRLVWGGEDSLRFVFLSPKGMSEVSYEFPEFIQKLAIGEAWLVESGDIPFLDQSLFGIVEDVYRQMNFQATHDALTGCMHRHDFEKRIWQRINDTSSNPEDDGAVLLVLDIDEFSVINASYGAEAGDALLRQVADLLKKEASARFSDACVGRISGNEFAVLCGQTALEDGLDFAEALRRNIEGQTFSHGPNEHRATASISVRPVADTTNSPGDLLNQASLSLRAAKKQGGNRIEVARPSEAQTPISASHWVTEIDRSIRDGSLYLRAQPIMPLAKDAKDGRMYELLLGLTDGSGREISPQGYIEAAEQFRRSTRVDLWVVSEVMKWMRENPAALGSIKTLNVNLSGTSLSDDTFMLGLESTLRQNADLAHKLCFEVTETSAVANLHFAADFMRELKRLNCRFALDDFGTGLSSYAYLQKLPVDFVKIDGIFVRDMASNLTNYAMVRSINELCHFLGLETIAEYVEDLEIVDTLREIQVDFGQGFGIAKPRRLDSLANHSHSMVAGGLDETS